MRIVHLVAIPQLTGAAEPVVDFVRASRALGATVDLYIDTKREGNLREYLTRAGDRVPNELTLSTKAGPIAGARDIFRLRRILPAYDVVHVHLSHDHALAALALGAMPHPILVRTVHAVRVLRPGWARRLAYRRADGITVACSRHRQQLIDLHGVDPSRIRVLGGSVDRERFFPDAAARERIRDQLALPKAEVAIGCVARFQAGRRHEMMLEALAIARRSRPEIRLLLIGHGETEPMIRARIESLSLREAVVFCGYKRQDLNDWLNALDAALWLVPGNDATSRAVLQAMAVGLPVIGGDVDGISETIRPEETGLLAGPDDPESIARAMIAIAADASRRKAMGEAGRKRALELYDPLERGKRTLAFYEELLRRRAGYAIASGVSEIGSQGGGS